MSDKGALAQKPITVMTALQMTVDRYPDKDIFGKIPDLFVVTTDCSREETGIE